MSPVDRAAAPLARYRTQLAARLGRINLRALPWFGATAEAIQFALAASAVLPRLVRLGEDAKALGLGDVLVDTPRAVIHGEPGAGKTTLLRYLCLAYTDEHSELLTRIEEQRGNTVTPTPTALVPVFLRMVEFFPRSESPQELDKFITKTLRDDHDRAIASAVVTEIRKGRGLVCLDGLDEIADDAVRERVVRVIETWATRTSGPCLVTTRSHGSLPLIDFTRLALQPFTPGDLREFLVRRALARKQELAVARQSAEAWMDRVWARPELRSLLRQPLLVELALAAEEAGRQLPTERVFLYESAIETLVKAWNKLRRPDALKQARGAPVDPETVLEALSAAALELFEDGELGRPIHRRELRRRLGRWLGGGSLGEDRAGGTLEVLVDQAGLLVPNGPDTLVFLHASYGEYLAAKGLVRAARHDPERILRRANSAQGREVVCMALSVARCIEGHPSLASLLFASLLSEHAGGPWKRLSGAPVRLAVEAVLEGHPLEACNFSRLLARVLDLVERAPLWVNTQALLALTRARPGFEVEADEARRILALLYARSPRLPQETVDALTRWVARLIPGSPAAQAWCEQALTQLHRPSTTWAALGLLRAGIVRRDLCTVVAEFLGNSTGDSPRETIIRDELAGPDATLDLARMAALRELLTLPLSERPNHRKIFAEDEGLKARVAPALVLAALGDDSDEVLAILAEGAALNGASRSSCRSALRWLAHTSDAASRGLGAALLAPDSALRNAAEDVFSDMLKRPLQAPAAAQAIFAAMARSPDLLPNPAAILAHDCEPSWTSFMSDRRERTLLETLHGLATGDPAIVATLTTHWRALRDKRPRWVVAGVLWRYALAREGSELADLAQCLYEGTLDEDLVVAVASANLLARGWKHLSHAGQQAAFEGWIRGLASGGPRVDDEPVDQVCLSAWQHLRDQTLDDDAREALRAVVVDGEGLRATLAATLMRDDPLVGPRASELILESLAADELQRVFVAVRGLDRGELAAELQEPLQVAQLRLMLSGWVGFFSPWMAATRTILDVFISAPEATLERDPVKQSVASHHLLPWLAQHPDARARAFAGLSAMNPSQRGRAARLLAACLTTPEQVAALVTEAVEAGPEIMGAASLALYERCLGEDDSSLGVAARLGLGELSCPLLAHTDLSVVQETVRRLMYVSVDNAESLPVARARMLAESEPLWRIEQIEDWLAARCPAKHREAAALRHFGCGLVVLTEALRSSRAAADPCQAIRAGLVLIALHMAWLASDDASTLVQGVVRRRVLDECAADVATLRGSCRSLLARQGAGEHEMSEEEGFADRDARYGLLKSRAARQLDQRVLGQRGVSRVWTWAVLTLVELDDAAVVAELVPLFDEPHSIGWYLLPWLVEHRPTWLPAFEAQIDQHWGRMHWRLLPQQVGPLRTAQALSPTLLARLAVRWAEQLGDWQTCVASFNEFIGGFESPPADLLAVWRSQLLGPEPALRDQAALALAGCGDMDDAVVEALIDTFLGWRSQAAAQRAFAALRDPARAEAFADRRRVRGRRWQTPREAAALAMLWSEWEEAERDREVLAPLLLAATQAVEHNTALCAALDLWHLDRAAAIAALTAWVPHSTRAAAWLFFHGEAAPNAEAKLWSTLEHCDDPACEWEPAAVLLHQRVPDDPRLPIALAQLARSGHADGAIWLLYGYSRVAAVSAALERLAGESPWRACEWLAAIHGGQRPGIRPGTRVSGYWASIVLESPIADSEHVLSPEDLDKPWFRLQGLPSLDILAERLLELEPLLRPEMREAMAGLLGGDAPRLTALWQRVHAAKCSPQDIDEVRELVELHADDRPAQQLARLWWRHQLAMTTLLELEERARRPRVGAATRGEPQLLADILAEGFPDDASLRNFLAGMGLHTEVAGPTATWAKLHDDAVQVLVNRGDEDKAVRRAASLGVLSAEVLQAWEQRGARRRLS